MKTQASKSHHSIDLCNEMLQDERSAVETYNRVLRKYSNEPTIREVAALRDEHKTAIRNLELQILQMGGAPGSNSHPWRSIRSMIRNSEDLFGDESALAALQEAEVRLLADYRNSLDDDLLPDCRKLCAFRLIPLADSHVRKLADLEEFIYAKTIPIY